MSNISCPQCGAPLDAGSTECKYCGEKIIPDSVSDGAYNQQTAYQQTINTQYNDDIDPSWPVKSKAAAGLLGIFLGAFGIHKFYMGKIGMGILYIVFCWTYIPAIVGFIEGIIYLCSSEHNFQVKNHVRLN